jgi:hypothetical protein
MDGRRRSRSGRSVRDGHSGRCSCSTGRAAAGTKMAGNGSPRGPAHARHDPCRDHGLGRDLGPGRNASWTERRWKQ